MRKLAGALLLAACCCVDVPASVPEGRLWIYQYLLVTSTTERELAPITEHIFHEYGLHEPELVDYVAEVLLARVDDADYPLQNKLRLIRVLGEMKMSRYATVLGRVESQTRDTNIRMEANAARLLAVAAGPEYVPGTIDIHAIVAEVDASALAAKPTTEQGAHLLMFPGGSFDALFLWAGKPQQMTSGSTRITDGMFIDRRYQRLSLFYRGLGRVTYEYNRSWKFSSIVADPMAFEREFGYRDRAQELGLPDAASLEMRQLLSNYTAAMRLVVEINYQRENRSLEFMDTAAEILVNQSRSANGPVASDMYAWICKLLSQRGGPRYTALLQRVAAETSDAKVKKYALLPGETPTSMPLEPYVPGTVSLDAQRAKYPTLYPDSAFQGLRP